MSEHSLQITLISFNKRLTVARPTSERNTRLENAIRATTEVAINNDPEHKKYGPWWVVASKWER